MNILVTGGAGFIASHIVDAYVAGGHNVTVVDNLSSGRRENHNPAARFIELDIRAPELEDLFRKGEFEVVNHHAAQMDVRRSVADPGFDAQVNILGTLNLLKNCAQVGVGRFIFASTGGAVYGEQEYFPADESHPTNPVSPYGISKLACEKYLHFHRIEYGIEHVVLRYTNVYGPRQNPHGEAGVVAIFAQRFLSGEKPTINGDGKQTRDYVFVDDVVQANVKALNFESSTIVNIGTANETDVNAIYRQVAAFAGADSEEAHGPAKPGEQRRSCVTFVAAERALSWRPAVSLSEGLRQTVDYFRSQGKS